MVRHIRSPVYGMGLMPNKINKTISILYTPEFKRNLRILSKKYFHIRSDIQPVIELLQKGEILADRIPRTGHPVFKVRVRNSDIKKGKRSGYRIIYFLKSPSKIILVTIYSKSDQGDITPEQIRHIIKEFEKNKTV